MKNLKMWLLSNALLMTFVSIAGASPLSGTRSVTFQKSFKIPADQECVHVRARGPFNEDRRTYPPHQVSFYPFLTVCSSKNMEVARTIQAGTKFEVVEVDELDEDVYCNNGAFRSSSFGAFNLQGRVALKFRISCNIQGGVLATEIRRSIESLNHYYGDLITAEEANFIIKPEDED